MKKHCKAGSFFPLLRQWLIGEQQRNSPAICWSPSAACVTSFDCGWVAFSPSHPPITILSELLHAQPKMAAAFPLLFPGEDGVVVDLWPLYLQQIDIYSWIHRPEVLLKPLFPLVVKRRNENTTAVKTVRSSRLQNIFNSSILLSACGVLRMLPRVDKSCWIF